MKTVVLSISIGDTQKMEATEVGEVFDDQYHRECWARWDTDHFYTPFKRYRELLHKQLDSLLMIAEKEIDKLALEKRDTNDKA